MICLDKTCLIDLDVFLSFFLVKQCLLIHFCIFLLLTNYSLFLFLATLVFVNDQQESNGTHIKNNLFNFCRLSNQHDSTFFYQINKIVYKSIFK